MHFLHLAAIRILRSLLFVVCGHMCFYLHVRCPKGVSFADVKGMMEWFLIFFLITLLINILVESSVPNVAMLAAATRKELNTTESWIILRILWIVFTLGMDDLLTNFSGEKCEGMRPEANSAHRDYAVVHMEVWGTIRSCCWSVVINFRSHVQIAWSIQWFGPRMDLCVSASQQLVMQPSSEWQHTRECSAHHPELTAPWKRRMCPDKEEVSKGREEHEKSSNSWAWDNTVICLRKGKQLIIWLRNPFEFWMFNWV